MRWFNSVWLVAMIFVLFSFPVSLWITGKPGALGFLVLELCLLAAIMPFCFLAIWIAGFPPVKVFLCFFWPPFARAVDEGRIK